jgi:hypothetical protein
VFPCEGILHVTLTLGQKTVKVMLYSVRHRNGR